MALVPLINGINYAWANITTTLFTTPLTGITAISYKRKQKKDNNFGAGVEPVSRGYGNREYEGSLELYYDTWAQIVAQAPNQDPTQIPPFPITVSFGGSQVTSKKETLQMVEFMEDPMESKQGDTKILVKIPLIIAGISK